MEQEITAYGLSRSFSLLLIFTVAFVGMTFVFVESLFSPVYPPFIVALFGACDALMAIGAIYGIVRYHSEEIIASNVINFSTILSQFIDDGDEEEYDECESNECKEIEEEQN